MIELRNASRWYGQVIGLNDVTCSVGAGMTALLGPNGAGKSTLIKLVTGQLRPTTGTVTVAGQRPFANPRVYRRLGYVPETDGFYDDLTGREFVSLLASLSGLRSRELQKRVDSVLETVGMQYAAERKIGGYSKGMRQRIKVAQAIVHDPDVLVLDEPLNGLDPVARREMTDLMVGLAEQGKSVLVSSHILYEVEQMTRSILLLYKGRLLARGDVYHIRSLIDKHPHRVSIEASDPRALARDLANLQHVVSIRFSDGTCRLEVETRDPDAFYSALPELADDGHQILGFESPDNNLEAVFRYLTEG
ncbi:MAG: ABC transporter ATP-binding protein [Armatimonadota bacterium]